MDAMVRNFLAKRLASNPRALVYYEDLWSGHLAAGLANKHFVSELTNGSAQKFAQRIWEMLLGRHLIACGCSITSGPKGEPDFRFERDGVVVWVEAVSPSPGPDLSNDPPSTGTTVPHQEILLRWTTAFDAKWKKGIEYRRKGVIKGDEAYVIAIDGSQLGWLPLSHGSSRMPYIVEAAFAMGPLAFKIDDESGRFTGTAYTVRFTTENRNGAPVRTEAFFNQTYAGIGGVIGCVPPMFSGAVLPIQVAYNPLAEVALSKGTFGPSDDEWTAELVNVDADGRDWILKKL
jgi:hypothetical protein